MAQEQRMIDVDATLEIIAKLVADDGMDVTEKIGRIIIAITESPTVDAVEVVHGRWEWDTEDIYKCSNCTEKSHVKEVMGQPDWDYCPNCGAKMDGGVSDG